MGFNDRILRESTRRESNIVSCLRLVYYTPTYVTIRSIFKRHNSSLPISYLMFFKQLSKKMHTCILWKAYVKRSTNCSNFFNCVMLVKEKRYYISYGKVVLLLQMQQGFILRDLECCAKYIFLIGVHKQQITCQVRKGFILRPRGLQAEPKARHVTRQQKKPFRTCRVYYFSV